MAKIGSKAAIEGEAGYVTLQAIDRLDRTIARLESRVNRLRTQVDILLSSKGEGVQSDEDVVIDTQDLVYELISATARKRLENSILFLAGAIEFQIPTAPGSPNDPVHIDYGFLKDGFQLGSVSTYDDSVQSNADPPKVVTLSLNEIDAPRDFESHIYTLWMEQTTITLTGVAQAYGIFVLEIT